MIGSTPQTFKEIVTTIYGFFNFLIPTLVGLALLYLLWGIAVFIMNAANEEARKTGRTKIAWGFVGLFVIVSIWGILAIVENTLMLPTR
jgi:hypothetical protein